MKAKLIFLVNIICNFAFSQESRKQVPFGISLFVEEDSFNKEFNQDRNYTGGGAVTLTGWYTESKWFIVPFFRERLDRLLCIDHISNHFLGKVPRVNSNSFYFGTAVFTPENLIQKTPVFGDRPYASLTFIASRKIRIWKDEEEFNDKIAITTELNLDLLGTGIGGSAQTEIHRYSINKNPNDKNNRPLPLGWDNQISQGGEPTAMYKIQIQNRLGTLYWKKPNNAQDYRYKFIDLSSSVESNLGYYTNVSIGLALRMGMFGVNFWQNGSNFGGSFQQYIGKNQTSSPSIGSADYENQRSKKIEWPTKEDIRRFFHNNFEVYGFAGGRSRLVAYNSLLQGQFKYSVYTLKKSQISRIVNEFELGLALRIWRITLIFEPIAGRTTEIKTLYSRTHIWGAGYISFNMPLK